MTEQFLDRYAFIQWLNAVNDVTDQDHSRVVKMMGQALQEELTEKQMRYVSAYYVEQLSMAKIGERYGIKKTTVSRTIKRAQRRIEKVIRYCSPVFLEESIKSEGTKRA